MMEAEADTPDRCQLKFSDLVKLEICFSVDTHSSFAAVIKCATEIKMDLVRIRLSCVQKH